MQCEEFDARMQRLLDDRKAPELDPKLLRHAQRCSSCQAQLATLSRLLDSLELLGIPELSVNFAQRAVDAAAEPIRAASPTRSRSAWVLAAAAIAAVLLLAAVPLTWQASNGRQSVAQPNPASKPLAATHRSIASQQSLSEADAAGDGWLVSSVSILELYPEETRQRHRQQVNRIADDLRPIATPFSAALTAIRRSIPVSKSNTKSEPRASLDRPLRTRNLS